MIKHVVLAKFNPGVTAEQIAELRKSLGTLPGRIPEIKGYDFGQDVRAEKPWISRWCQPSRIWRR
jgi:hypothetical protein